MPREIEYEKVVEAVKEIALRANYKLPKDVGPCLSASLGKGRV
jgi:hypothetical protein